MADPGTGAFINQLMNPPNPFATAGQSAQGLNALMQLRADRAAADAYQQSIDPQTGQFDPGKFQSLLAQGGPGATFHLGATMEQAGRGNQAQAAGSREQLQSNLDQLGAQSLYLQPLAAKAATGQQVTAEEITTMLQGMPAGVMPESRRQQLIGQVAGMSPAQATTWVQGAAYANSHATSVVQSHLPGVATLPTGGGALVFNPNPSTFAGQGAGASSTPYGYNPYTLTPESAGATETITLPGGQSIQVPHAVGIAILSSNPELQRLNPNFAKPAAAPAAPKGADYGGGRPAAPPPAAAPGRYPQPQPQPASAPSTPPKVEGPEYVQPPPPAPPEAGGVGVPPQAGYTDTVTVPSQKAATALAVAAKDTPNVSALIDDMRSQVNQPGWNPGLGAQAGSTWRQFLDKIGVNATGNAPTAIKDAQAAYDEFSKDANLIASRQLSTLGNPSDARQGLAEAITPGMAQSKEGVLGISATLKGNQDAINRMATAWEQAKQQGWSDGRHNEWVLRWNATDKASGGKFDPRVFWLADTAGNADDQWRRMASKIPKDQQAQFLKNVQYAKGQGWISQDGQGGAFSVVNP